MPIQFRHISILGLKPISKGSQGCGLRIVLRWLVHQQPYALCRVVLVAVHDFLDIDRRMLANFRIIQVGAVVIESCFPDPSRRIFGA